MSVVSDPLRKRVRGSKKSKKAWRKTDINDIEEHLAEKRKEELTGGPIAAKPNEALFFVDVDGISSRQRLKRIPKPLKIDEIIASNRYIKGPTLPGANNDHLKRKSKHETAIVIKKSRILKAKDVPATPTAGVDKNGTYDLWQDSISDALTEASESSGAEAYLQPVLKKPVKRPVTLSLKPSSDVAPVQVVPPGGSYNPDHEAHQALLQEAVDAELKKIAEAAKYETAVDLEKHDRTKAAEERMIFDSIVDDIQASFHPTEQEEEEQGEEVNGRSFSKAASSENRKTKAQRAKEKLHKEQERQREEEKKEKQRIRELSRIKAIKAELASQEKQQDKTRIVKPTRLGKHRYVTPDIDLKLSDELPSSLRSLTAEGNLLRDRYVSLQSRHIIEPRVPVKKTRRYMIKAYEKRPKGELAPI